MREAGNFGPVFLLLLWEVQMGWQSLLNRITIKRHYERRYGRGQHPWTWFDIFREFWRQR
jgi:hypothetical protein